MPVSVVSWMPTTKMTTTRGTMTSWTRTPTTWTRTTDERRDYLGLLGQRHGCESSNWSGPGRGNVPPPLSPQGGLGGGEDGNEDAKNKRWAESVGMDIKRGRGEKTTTLYKRGHLGLQEDGIHVHRKSKKKDKKDKK